MKDQINTIREALDLIDHNEWEQRNAALTALAQLEAMVREQEPVAFVNGAALSRLKNGESVPAYNCWGSPWPTPLYAAPVAQQPQAEPTCNPHPKAPHGFNRNASHNAGRYVCDCEGWDAWDDGYSAGWQAGFDADAAPQQAEAVPAWTTEQITAVAQPIAVAIAENCRTAPQLVFPHLFLGLKDLLTGKPPQQAEAVPSDVVRDAMVEAACGAVAAALGDAYDCGRVWSAWSYGTMGPDDFSQVSEDSDRVREIAVAAIDAAIAQQKGGGV